VRGCRDASLAWRYDHRNDPRLLSLTLPHRRAILATPTTAAEWIIEGRVVGITDGDTIKVVDAGSVQHKVRLAAIDAPESGQPFGA
jgi:endonuclease YncB( thermonuclease family)